VHNRTTCLALVAGAVLLAIGIRLYLAWAYYGNFDQQSYEIVQGIMRSGGNVYAETSRYNYSPVWAYVLAWLGAAGSVVHWPDHATIRTFLTLVDVITAMVLLRLGGISASLAFVLNPVSILITGYHGQFDGMAVLALLLATSSSNALRSGALAVLAVLVKHIVLPLVLFIHPTAPLLRRLIVAAIALLALVVSVLPFAGGGAIGIARNVFAYGGVVGEYGVTSLHPALALPVATVILRAMLVLAFLLLAIRSPTDPIRAILVGVLLFLVLTPGFGTQYFVLPIAFGALRPSKWFWLYTLVATWHILGSPVELGLVPATHPDVVWIVAIAWFAAELLRREAPADAINLPPRHAVMAS
jgi:hypothetical protein